MTDEFDPLGTESIGLKAWYDDLIVATGLLTTVPVSLPDQENLKIARSTRMFPIVGLLVGLAGSVVLALGDWLNLPAAAAVLLALVAMALITGGLHEDGLADVCDGFGGGHTKDDILTIMRDSRIGTYGVLGLVFIVGLKVTALTALLEQGLSMAIWTMLGAAVMSRGLVASVMFHVPHARTDGLSVSAGRPEFQDAMTALGVGLVLALFALGFGAGLVAFVLAAVAVIGLVYWTSRWLGGQTGDVLGAVQQVSETVILLTIAALLG